MLFRAESAFGRVDDVMQFFTIAQVEGTNIHLHHYPHALRQWYEGSQVCIASYSTPDANEQGLQFTTFAVPSILEEPRLPTRANEDFATRPHYVCINHIFDFGGGHYAPSNMVMRGDAVDENLTMKCNGGALEFTVTERYVASLHRQAQRARARQS